MKICSWCLEESLCFRIFVWICENLGVDVDRGKLCKSHYLELRAKIREEKSK